MKSTKTSVQRRPRAPLPENLLFVFSILRPIVIHGQTVRGSHLPIWAPVSLIPYVWFYQVPPLESRAWGFQKLLD